MVELIRELALAHPAHGCNRDEAMLALEAKTAEKVVEITPEQAALLEQMTPCSWERYVESSETSKLLPAEADLDAWLVHYNT
ncbi:hypothetical protein DFP89_1171 [Paracoccus lutimaris]|uniref:Uncharacterized protein n=1 Tax=Paracoccus lutimaris TaxID=1490030 RepID=A0A368YN88_9RHOB|nr:hypothetical protein DFP89_1171 [Paracoccus lutimaris]